MNETTDNATYAIESGEIYTGYSMDEEIRSHASSGGIVSSLLVDMISSGRSDGALVSRITSIKGDVRAVTRLAKTKREVLIHAGSSYIDTPVLAALARLDESIEKLVVVCLPCQARMLRRVLAKRPGLEGRLVLVIALFCRGAVSCRLYGDLFSKLGLDRSNMASLQVDRGRRKGTVTITHTSGKTTILPFEMLNAYRVAGIHSLRRCLWCDEHMGREADIAVGDIFTREYENRDIKHSALVCWSTRGSAIVEDLGKRGILHLEYFGMKRYRETFGSIETFSNRLEPRYIAARITGVPSKRNPSLACNLFHAIGWSMFFLNFRISRSVRGRNFLFRLPPQAVRLQALAIKALSRIRM